MQSGITASAELHAAFNTFTSDPSLFALPITITGESLTPLSPLPFASSSSSFSASLPSLKPHLQPKTPIYLVLRPSPSQSHGLLAVTYVPATAPVRQKMLFASTRNTLTRDLGLEKFGEQIFATDEEEILEPAQWEGRARAGVAAQSYSSGQTQDILSREERELQTVKRAEEEERHGTQGRDLMGSGGSGSRLAMKITDDARSALATLDQDGVFVQLGIELASETLELVKSETGAQAALVLAEIPRDKPSYTFFHYPGTAEVLFLYTCPGTSRVRERMVYASARASVLQAAAGEGVNVTRRLEAGGPDEITEARLAEEVGVAGARAETGASTGANRQGFARPKRPGKR